MSWGSRTHYHPIVIDHTLVGSGMSGGFTGLLTKACILDEVMDADGDHPAKSDGGDVLIASVNDGTGRFSLDIIVFTLDNTPANALAQIAYRDADGIWAPSSVTDLSIYVGWGDASASQPAASADYGSDDAYDADWKGFWPNASVTDRTSNNTDLTATGSPGTAAGKVGTAWDLDGSTQYLEAATPITDEPMTLLSWCYPDVNNVQMAPISISSNDKTSDNAWAILFRGTTGGDPISGFITATSGGQLFDIGNFASTTWYMSAVIMASNTSRFGYVSGTLSAEHTVDRAVQTPNIVNVGTLYDDSSSAYTNFWNGAVDSPSIHSTNRSEAWLDTWYNQTNTPGTYHTPGAAVEIGGTTAELAASIDGEGDVTGAASGTAGAAASIEGEGDLTGQASGTAAASATIEGEGDVTGQVSGVASGAASIEGEGDASGAPTATTIASIAASIEGEGDVVGAASEAVDAYIDPIIVVSPMSAIITVVSPMDAQIEVVSPMSAIITVRSPL